MSDPRAPLPGWGGPRSLSTRDALEVLQHCPQLEMCNIEISTGFDESYSSSLYTHSDVAFYMQHLWHLCVVDNGEDPVAFFRNFHLPNLRSLEYSSKSFGHSVFPFLLSPDNCVERLSLWIPGTDSNTVLDSLRLMPMIQHLSLLSEPVPDLPSWFNQQSSNDHILPLLIPGRQPDTILPCLRSVRLLDVSAISDLQVLEFILARTDPDCETVARLSNVYVKFARDMDVDIIALLGEHIAEGFQVTLKYAVRVPYSPSDGNVVDSAEWGPCLETRKDETSTPDLSQAWF
ncbi:hypothetical protein C8R44DRAFT_865588 [Mycena epipterygia]|nr:hypothetical protein C8R44DRAFT_865588 [Mycena epipterygia]